MQTRTAILVGILLCFLGCTRSIGPKYQDERDGFRTTGGLLQEADKVTREVSGDPDQEEEVTLTVAYSYEVDGKDYLGSDTFTTTDRDLVRPFHNLEGESRPVTVYYDPNNPEDSHIFRRVNPEWEPVDSTVAWVGLLALVLGFLGFRLLRRASRNPEA